MGIHIIDGWGKKTNDFPKSISCGEMRHIFDRVMGIREEQKVEEFMFFSFDQASVLPPIDGSCPLSSGPKKINSSVAPDDGEKGT